MLDYIDILLQTLYEEGPNDLDGDFFRQQALEKQAGEALSATLTAEQMALYLTYESEHNATAQLYTAALTREAFLLAREIFR